MKKVSNILELVTALDNDDDIYREKDGKKHKWENIEED